MLPHLSLTLVLLIFIQTLSITHQSNVPPAASCENYNATQNLLSMNPRAKCLEPLSNPSTASRYKDCKTQPCFLFRWSSPSVLFDKAVFHASATDFQHPFSCKNPGSLHPSLRGIVFKLMGYVAPENALCIWAGAEEQCSFNALVDFTTVMAEQGYQFAIAGLMLDLPKRRCNHFLSSPIHDNRIIIIGNRNSFSDHALYQLAKPFRLSSWLIIALVVIMFFVVCGIGVVKMRSVRRDGKFLTALQMFTGSLDLPLRRDEFGTRSNGRRSVGYKGSYLKKYGRCNATFLARRRRRNMLYRSTSDVAEDEDDNNSDIARNKLSTVLFRIALGAFLGVFALFYEVAVVNFLFQQNTMKLSKSIEFLSDAELRKYSVLRNSAQEVVLLQTVNKNGNRYDLSRESDIPWKRCSSGQECVQWVADNSNEVEYAVTYETKGSFLIHSESSCDKLAILETKNALYHFSSAWLYTRGIDREFIEMIDRQLVNLRIQGEVSETYNPLTRYHSKGLTFQNQLPRIFESVTGDTSCESLSRADIGPSIIGIPFGTIVLPLLFGSLFVMFFWRRKRPSVKEIVAERKVRTPRGSFGTAVSVDTWEEM